MASKSIQFRGISRIPSGRINTDGGCSESINVQLQQDELVPALPAKSRTDIKAGNIVYVHKTPSHTNYIYYESSAVGTWKKVSGTWTWSAIVTFENETLENVTSIGNTLVLVTDCHKHYVHLKDGSYVYLGTTIPMPDLYFNTSTGAGFSWPTNGSNMFTTVTLDNQDINNWISQYDIDADKTIALDQVSNFLWKVMQQGVADYRINHKEFVTPFFLRYAIKLYDGSYIYQSVPILLGAEVADTMYSAKILNHDNTKDWFVKITYAYSYAVYARLTAWDVSDWRDIVSSVDIFYSTAIHNPQTNSRIKEVGNKNTSDTMFGWSGTSWNVTGYYQKDKWTLTDEIESKSNFYLYKSFPIEELIDDSGTHTGDLWNRLKLEPMSDDDTVLKKSLPDGYLTEDEIIPTGELRSYNNRLLIGGYDQILTPGYRYMNATVNDLTKHTKNITLDFYIRDSYGETHHVLNSIKATTPEREFYSFIAYPNPACYRVDIYHKDEDQTSYCMNSYRMSEHPSLNCSYYFGGLSTKLLTDTSGTHTLPIYENPKVAHPNQLLQSEVDNPFLFPVEGRHTFVGRVIGMASTVITTSSYQNERYDLYAFTDNGIYALGMNQDGTFGTETMISRETAKDGTISPIDMAVVFATDKSVMLLSGNNEISDLAVYMHGKNRPVESAVATAINAVTSNALSLALASTEPFMGFMDDARCAYDYKGKRLIFFADGFAYQYVYMLESQTWHKIIETDASNSAAYNLVNSYPECIITRKTGSTYKILDYATELGSVDSSTVITALIETREINLDNTDVFKSITDIHMRGDYKKTDSSGYTRLKYMLLGSNDGQTFHVLRSLKGLSWKFYKIAVLMKFNSTDRLSYVDIDYLPRFIDKTR